MVVAGIQLSTLPLSYSRIDYYLRICQSRGAKIVVLGEYVLNSFFKDLENTPLVLIKEQTKRQLTNFKKLAKLHNLIIVAPIILIIKNNPYKVIAKFQPTTTGVVYEHQQCLINYKHWNEEKFFNNKIEELREPLTFMKDGIKFGILFGFEIHFDYFWTFFLKRKVDVVLIPTASTFDSQDRWNELLKTRAFLNNFYILRVNRIGEYTDNTKKWVFYGDTTLTNPYGEIEGQLSDKEEVLICDINKEDILEAKKNWGFKDALQKRNFFN